LLPDPAGGQGADWSASLERRTINISSPASIRATKDAVKAGP